MEVDIPALHKDFELLRPDEDELTDEQMHELLKRAQVRLREKASSGKPISEDSITNFKLPQLKHGDIPKAPVKLNKSIAKADLSSLIPHHQKRSGNAIRKVEDPVVVKKRIREEKKATKGSDWFNLPRTDLTPEVKRDLQLIQMRSVLDPKRHYKKQTGKAKAPEYSQVGTIIEGPTEFFSARIPNRERKRTLAEEMLAVEATTGRFKKKYNEIQASKTSGKKAYYKQLKAKRARNPRKG